MFGWIANWLRAVGDNSGPYSFHDPRGWEVVGWSNNADSGESVSASSALSLPAVWQAVGMISGDVSKLPLKVYRRSGDNREPDDRHPVSKLIGLNGWANTEVSALTLWRRLMVHALIWPRGYVWIDKDMFGKPIGLYNLLPDRTTIKDVDGSLRVATEVGGNLVTIPFRDVLIVENIGLTETESFGPLIAARHNMGLQLAKRKFASKFFANGMHAGGILQVPPGASDKARRKIEESLRDKAFTKDNAFKTMVLRDGFKWHQTMIDPERAQMTEVEEQEVRNIARFYRMAPSRLGVKESISYNSEEAARRAYHDETLSYWLTAIKSECNLKLLSMPGTRNRFIDYKIEALLWADTATVISVGVQGVTNGIFSRDEVRRWFNMNPIPDGEGEKFLVPLNMGTAGDEPEQPDDPDEDATEEEQDQAARTAIRQVIENAIRRAVRPTMRAIERAETGKRDAAQQKLRQMLGDIEQLAESAGYGSNLTGRMADAILLRPLDYSLENQLPGWMLDKEPIDA